MVLETTAMKLLGVLLTSPAGSTLAITLGVGAMLSISFLDPGDSRHILQRQDVADQRP